MTPATATPFELSLASMHRSVAGFCVALLLVAGMISVPTSCDCGAGVPHGHSLFILNGHHHGSDGAVFRAKSDTHEHQHHGHHAKEAPSVEAHAQLGGRITHSSDRVSVAIPALEMADTAWQRVSYPPYSESTAGGRVISPEAPPPQQGQIL